MSILDEEGQRQVQMRFLDLSGVHISTKEELQNIMFKMLEVRLRPDKLSEDEINRIIYCESSSPTAEYPFLDPIPASMKDVNLAELSQVDIDWRMLTLARPSTKQEMEIFTRFVDLEKLKLKSMCEEDERAEVRLSAIKVKVQADGFEEETNSDEFTYEYFSRRHAVEDISQNEDSSKKPPEEEKRKLSQKLDSVARQETLFEPPESPSPVPFEAEPEQDRKMRAKKRVKKIHKKKFKRRNRKRKKRRRRIKRLKNGRVVFITVKRKKKWYSLRKKKKQAQNAVKSEVEGKAVEEPAVSEDHKGEVNDSQGLSRSVDVKSSSKSQRTVRNKKSNKVSSLKNPSKEIRKTEEGNNNNVSKTGAEVIKSGPGAKLINIPKRIKGTSRRLVTKRGTFARSASKRLTAKNPKAAKQKSTQTTPLKKKSAKAKLDADGKEIEADEMGKEGRDSGGNHTSAKLSSTSSGKKKINVKNRTSLKTLVSRSLATKRTPKSPPKEPPSSEDSKENNKAKDI